MRTTTELTAGLNIETLENTMVIFRLWRTRLASFGVQWLRLIMQGGAENIISPPMTMVALPPRWRALDAAGVFLSIQQKLERLLRMGYKNRQVLAGRKLRITNGFVRFGKVPMGIGLTKQLGCFTAVITRRLRLTGAGRRVRIKLGFKIREARQGISRP